MKHHDCDRPQGTSIATVKIQTTSFADVLEWCSPSKKVCIEFEELFNGKCIPTHAPNNVLIVTLILTRPLRGDEVITFEPSSGLWPVLINESHCSDD
ncbi:hypothetical protein [Paenibacillus selenitireducens]|uniref:hypothetical protein n=1 Tax=Paenibacillus selenitireducens TaxID=1324314 RepID=UPI00117D0D62|nr:hypothetical protein [Paenibacillus selenitireducens]